MEVKFPGSPPQDPGIYPHPDDPNQVLVVQESGSGCTAIGRWCPHNPDTDLLEFGQVRDQHLICRHKPHKWQLSDGSYCGTGIPQGAVSVARAS